MKVSRFENPVKNYPYKTGPRCERMVFHSGDGSGPRPQKTCTRFAKCLIDDRHYCHQHAGEMCLEEALKN